MKCSASENPITKDELLSKLYAALLGSMTLIAVPLGIHLVGIEK
jgi:hypothetical protein